MPGVLPRAKSGLKLVKLLAVVSLIALLVPVT
jgi:hypothetical protein